MDCGMLKRRPAMQTNWPAWTLFRGSNEYEISTTPMHM